ncbi:MAG: nucleotidyltransferase family protein [Candidatus Wallbacteria bacterium]|nr:nucleotidyltransferase family protein [Candidatus Wallbacteria bacterium]MBI4866775.1 nucleotidyltransferase family protein [Candidatus Wallbacteria bacterium]
MDRLSQIRDRREEILKLASSRGVRNPRLVGSVARGTAGPRSDVDLVVDLDPGAGLLDLGALVMDLRELLGCAVEIIPVSGIRPGARDELLREAVAL